jgi:hypothetical protein
MGYLKAFLRWWHTHRWMGSGWNYWYIETEQRCSCGEHRHHLWEDFRGFEEPNWRPGRHPVAIELIKSGKTKTDGFDEPLWERKEEMSVK